MMRPGSMLLLTAALAVPLLAACKKAETVRPEAQAEAAASKPSEMASSTATVAPPMLAYAYAWSLRLPSAQVRPLMSRHEQACMSAGPQLCQVIAADVKGDRDEASGTLKLRAAEVWLMWFRGGLDADVKEAGGSILSSSTGTEDLTRPVSASDADLRSNGSLRERLEKLQAQHPGKLQDKVALEREIAELRRAMDAERVELQSMRARLAMAEVSVDYASAPVAIGSREIAPLSHALRGFAGNSLGVLAALVTIASFVLPLGLAGAVAWAAWRWARRRMRKA